MPKEEKTHVSPKIAGFAVVNALAYKIHADETDRELCDEIEARLEKVRVALSANNRAENLGRAVLALVQLGSLYGYRSEELINLARDAGRLENYRRGMALDDAKKEQNRHTVPF